MPKFVENFSKIFLEASNISNIFTSLKKISCKIFAMSKTQRIFITKHYLHSSYWTKMSDTFTFNRIELVTMSEQTMEF